MTLGNGFSIRGHRKPLRKRDLQLGTYLEVPRSVTRSRSRQSGTGRKEDGDEIQSDGESDSGRSPRLASLRKRLDGRWRGGKREDEPDRAGGSGCEQSHRGAEDRNVPDGEDGLVALPPREPVLLQRTVPHTPNDARSTEDLGTACARTQLTREV